MYQRKYSTIIMLLHRFTVILLSVVAANLSRTSAQFVESPVSNIAYLGDHASFSCTTDGSHLLVWTVNGVEARLPEVHNRGIRFVHHGINSEMSNLTVLASIQNNNSEIICIQENLITGQEIARTRPAYLYVQGLLEAPANVTVDFRNKIVIHLTWLPPFSLKDILSYSITVLTGETSNEIEIEMRNTTHHNFTYTWRPSFEYCKASFTFQIAAVNALGVGSKTRRLMTSFLRPFIEASPSNKTVRVGEWNNITCAVHCSLSEYITWFVRANGSTLPLFDGAMSGLKVQNFPGSSLCSTSHALTKETHSVALMLTHDLDLPLMIYCTVISVCKRNMPDCTTYSCYSQNAHLDTVGTRILSTESQPTHHVSTSDKEVYPLITTLGLGALLMLTVLAVIIAVIANVLRRQRKENQQQHSGAEEKDAVYDVIMPEVTVQPSTCSNTGSDLVNDSSIAAPTALQYCPAYQTSSCIRKS